MADLYYLPESVRKVLLLRMDRVGDMLLSTPAIRCVREAVPSAHLTLVASPYNAPVLRGWECVDEIRSYDTKWPRSRKQEFVRTLCGETYDLCLVLSSLMESYKLASRSRAKVRAGILYSRRIWSRMIGPQLLTHPMVVDIDGAVARRERVPHEVEQLLRLVQSVGLPARDRPLEVPLSTADSDWARAVIPGPADARVLIGLHLCEKWFSAGWTPLGLAVLVEQMLDAIPGSHIVITHGPWDADAAERLRPYLEGENGSRTPSVLSQRVSLLGDLTFGRWAGVLSLCRVVLTRDTGSLHLAAALGRPVVAIYERGSFHHNAQQWAPWMIPHHSLESGQCSETSAEILRKTRSLLEETARRAA